jgi:hypothetical protein
VPPARAASPAIAIPDPPQANPPSPELEGGSSSG